MLFQERPSRLRREPGGEKEKADEKVEGRESWRVLEEEGWEVTRKEEAEKREEEEAAMAKREEIESRCDPQIRGYGVQTRYVSYTMAF